MFCNIFIKQFMLNFWPHNLHLQLNWWSYKYVDAKGSFATKQTIVITLSISLYDEQWVCMKDLNVFAVDVVGVHVFCEIGSGNSVQIFYRKKVE